MNKIPCVDLADFLSSNSVKKKTFIKTLGNAFDSIGFVILKGHYLEASVTEALYEQIKLFFSLPEKTKKKYEIEGMAGQRGYTSFGKESAKGRKEADLKEFWHFGQYHTPPAPITYPDNVWVEELPAFNRIGKEVFQLLETTGTTVVQAIALYLQLDEGFFDSHVTHGNSILRPIHYPPIRKAPENALRAAPHGDINLITLLMGAHGKGLQVQTRDNQWIDAIAQEGELIINLGDMMARLTNNRLKSTVHQVVNPPRDSWGESRYSIPFFMHPNPEMPLNCLKNCISDEHPKAFPDCTAGEFLDERLIELGLKKTS